MKRARGSVDPRIHFYELLLEYAGDVLFNQLATLRGTFRPEQRLIVRRIAFGVGAPSFMPDDIIRSVEDAKAAIFLYNDTVPLCLEFSGICPALHVEDLPWYRTPKKYQVREDKPRKRDREYNRVGVASWLGEMVLDVDLSEEGDNPYDRRGVCKCVGKRQCCDECWVTFLRPAQRVIALLLKDAGIQAYFFVYSGRRGFHCWIVDRNVVRWTKQQRTAVISCWNTLHTQDTPLVDRILEILEPTFKETPALLERYQRPLYGERKAWRHAVFQALYPKFDIPVSQDPTHNHKMPLMLHPSTHQLCMTMEGDGLDFLPSENRFLPGDVSKALLERGIAPIVHALDMAYK